jgi:hypothetical protein
MLVSFEEIVREWSMDQVRLFDLNIEKILEAWDNTHAVRELISNALDEQILTKTADIKIYKPTNDTWAIRDFGRGLRYEHFTQNENPEKLASVGRVIGKFGVGLKDALATLDRNGVEVEIESAQYHHSGAAWKTRLWRRRDAPRCRCVATRSRFCWYSHPAFRSIRSRHGSR